MSLIKRVLSGLDSALDATSRVVNTVGVVILLFMAFAVTADAMGRYLFDHPIEGTMDIMVYSLVTTVFLGMAYTQFQKGHVGVDILISRLSRQGLARIWSVNWTLAAGILVLLVWQSFLYARRLWLTGQASAALDIPDFYFVLVLVFGAALLLLMVVKDLAKSIATALSDRSPASYLAVILSNLFSLLLCAAIVAHWLPVVSPQIAGLISMGFLVILLFTGMPVGFVLAILGFLGMSYLTGIDVGLKPLGMQAWSISSNYSYIVIPLFVLMGELTYASGLGSDLYSAAYKWVGRLPGGLASATIGACAAFASICGSSVATAVTLGTVALPEMKRYGYDDAMATGTVAAGGTIGILIPPSITFVIYGIITEQSIGRLFIAGIMPGILLTLLFIGMITIRVKLNPKLGPPGPSSPLKEKLASLKGTWAVVLLFLLVVGGIYLGVFSSTEAAGIGAFGALAIGLVQRRIKRQGLYKALLVTGKITSMSFLILIGAEIISTFLAVSRLPNQMADFVSALPLPPVLILTAIIIVYIILGCLMPAIPMIILTMPIFFPTIIALGYDPIWFGVVIVILSEMALVTPPVGMNVYVVAGITKDIPMSTVFRGIFPFVWVLAVLIIILIIFPQIALFLPNLMKG